MNFVTIRRAFACLGALIAYAHSTPLLASYKSVTPENRAQATDLLATLQALQAERRSSIEANDRLNIIPRMRNAFEQLQQLRFQQRGEMISKDKIQNFERELAILTQQYLKEASAETVQKLHTLAQSIQAKKHAIRQINPNLLQDLERQTDIFDVFLI